MGLVKVTEIKKSRVGYRHGCEDIKSRDLSLESKWPLNNLSPITGKCRISFAACPLH